MQYLLYFAAPFAALLLYCARQKPKAPFFKALAVGAVGGAVIGTRILSSMYGTMADTFPIVIFYPPVGAIAGAFLGTAAVNFGIDPTERRIGAICGLVAGLLTGWLLLLLIPQSSFLRQPTLLVTLGSTATLSILVCAPLGASLAGQPIERRRIAVRGFALCLAVLLIVALASSPTINRHISAPGDLEQEGDLKGLRYKIERGDANVRFTAAASYARKDPLEALRHPDKFVRYEAAIVLGGRDDERGLPVLESAVMDAQWRYPTLDQRLAAVEALGKMKSPAARRVLVTASRSPVIWVREAAINLLALPTLKMVRWRGDEERIEMVRFATDGKTLASTVGGWANGKNFGAVRLWDTETGKQLRELEPQADRVLTVDYAHDGKTLACGSGNQVTLWGLEQGVLKTTFSMERRVVMALAIAPDGNTLAAGHGSSLMLWNVPEGKAKPLPGGSGFTTSLAYSLDGRVLAAGMDGGQVALWDVTTGRQTASWQAHTMGSVQVAISPDGTRLATAGDDGAVRRAKIWNLPSREPSQVMKTYVNALSVALSPDGRTLAAGYSDYRVRLWDVKSGRLIRFMDSTKSPLSTGTSIGVRSVAFSPDGSRIASGDDSGQICVWRLK